MNVWSTEHLPRRDRFEYWREERARRLSGAEIEVEPERRLDFTARIGGVTVGAATVVEIACSSYALRRTQRAIDRTPENVFAIWQVTRGCGLLLAGGGEETVGTGTITSGRSDLPYTHIPGDRAISGFRALRIPIDTVAGHADLGGLIARTHPTAPGVGALLAAYFVSFMEQIPHLSGPAAEHAVQALMHLALAARGARDPRDAPGTAAIRLGLLDRAHRLIERDLHRSNLTPSRVAGQLGISVRKLHLLFEPSGESFSRRVLARRLDRADRLLLDAPGMPVTEVAYASGFDSLSTFFRCYRVAFGASPSERRAAMRGPGGRV